jgi:hypothetical protein
MAGKAAGQGCWARLTGKADWQGCRARLPGKAAGQGCRERLPGKSAGQGCRARLPGKAGCRARLSGTLICLGIITCSAPAWTHPIARSLLYVLTTAIAILLYYTIVLFICLSSARQLKCLRVSKTESYGISRICFEMTHQATMPSSSAEVSSRIQNREYGLSRICFEITRQATIPSSKAWLCLADEQHIWLITTTVCVLLLRRRLRRHLEYRPS